MCLSIDCFALVDDGGDWARFAFDFALRSTLAERILPTNLRMELVMVAPTVLFFTGAVCVSIVWVAAGRESSDDDANRVF